MRNQANQGNFLSSNSGGFGPAFSTPLDHRNSLSNNHIENPGQSTDLSPFGKS